MGIPYLTALSHFSLSSLYAHENAPIAASRIVIRIMLRIINLIKQKQIEHYAESGNEILYFKIAETLIKMKCVINCLTEKIKMSMTNLTISNRLDLIMQNNKPQIEIDKSHYVLHIKWQKIPYTNKILETI
jgi:hypothetical protein